MAVSKKPPRPAVVAEGESLAIALINKGGTSSAEQKPQEKTVAVVLRLPSEMLEQIDKLVKARPIRTPRHMWLLEAVHEKLQSEEPQSAGAK